MAGLVPWWNNAANAVGSFANGVGNFVGGAVHNVENFANTAVHDVGNTVNNVEHFVAPQQPQKRPQPQQQGQPQYQAPQQQNAAPALPTVADIKTNTFAPKAPNPAPQPNIVGDIANFLSTAGNDVNNFIVKPVENAGNAFASGINTGVNDVKQAINQDVVKPVAPIVNDIANSLNALPNDVHNVINASMPTVNTIGKIAGELGHGVVQAPQAFLNTSGKIAQDLAAGPIAFAKTTGGIANGVTTGLINTAKLPTDITLSGVGALTHNTNLRNAANQQLGSDFNNSLPGSIYHPLDVMGTALGSSLAADKLYNEGVDPNIVTNAVNQQTAHVGLNTNNSQTENDRKIASAAAQTALNIAMFGQPLGAGLKDIAGAQTGKYLTSKTLKDAAAKVAQQQGRTAAQQLIRTAAQNAAYGGAGGAASTLEQNKISPQDFLTNTLKGSAGGALAGVAMPLTNDVLTSGVNVAAPIIAKSERLVASTPDIIKNAGKATNGAVTKFTEGHNAEVSALSDHMNTLELSDAQMANNGLSPNSAARINNRKARAATQAALNVARQKARGGGYIRLGFPSTEELSADIQSRLSPEAMASGKVTAKDMRKVYPTGRPSFSQGDLRTIIKNSSELKKNPVMHFEPVYKDSAGNTYPALVHDGEKSRIIINAGNLLPSGTDLSHIPRGEQVDLSRILHGKIGKIPAIVESKLGEKLTKGRTDNVSAETSQLESTSLSPGTRSSQSNKPNVLSSSSGDSIALKSAHDAANKYANEHPIAMGIKSVGEPDDALAALKKEALKYKSADELPRALDVTHNPIDMGNGKVLVLRGARSPKEARLLKEGVFNNPSDNKVLYDNGTVPMTTDYGVAKGFGSNHYEDYLSDLAYAKSKGYPDPIPPEVGGGVHAFIVDKDALKANNDPLSMAAGEKELTLTDKSKAKYLGEVKNEKQLIDLYDQAHAEAKAKAPTKPSEMARKPGAKASSGARTSDADILKALGASDKEIASYTHPDSSLGQSTHSSPRSPESGVRMESSESTQPVDQLGKIQQLKSKRSQVAVKDARKQLASGEKNLLSQTEDRNVSSSGNIVPPAKKGAPTADYNPQSGKVKIGEVAPGDYGKVRSNAQLVSSMVANRGQNVIRQLEKMKAVERSTFWHVVEGTDKAKSPEMVEAVKRWREMADRVHATSEALGGHTQYLKGYARHNWDLSTPEAQEIFNKYVKSHNAKMSDPKNFRGLDTAQRIFGTIKEGQAAGLTLKHSNPIDDIKEYENNSIRKLRHQAVDKGVQEAEVNEPNNTETLRMGDGLGGIAVTKEGLRNLRSIDYNPSHAGKALKGYRRVNKGLKNTLLSVSQFHPINIAMQSASSLALKGHPVRAFNAAVDGAVAINKKYADAILNNAIHDGTLEDAARIGTPISMRSDYADSGKLDVNAARGERMIFERQLPVIHIQMVKAAVSDLKKRGISLDSPEARKAGLAIDNIMGYTNAELRNYDPKFMRGLGDIALAPQFTLSKWQTIGTALKPGGGQAGSWARSAVIGKYAAQAAIVATAGAILGQQSDGKFGSMKWLTNTLLRTLLHPSIPTPFKDSKGNTIELGLPANYASESLGLGIGLNRNKNGWLVPAVSGGGVASNLGNYGRARLATVPSDLLKVVTNKNFADKPLYDPNASTKSKIAQGATTILGGTLPIGAQGLIYTNAVKNAAGRIPGVGEDIKNVLNAETPGSNPILKALASSVGATARTDHTTGKGLQTTQYYNALDQAQKGLTKQGKDALDMYTGGKKNPVTGQYEVSPTAEDSIAKAAALLKDNLSSQQMGGTSAIDNLIKMNQSLAAQGQKVDPLWLQSKANIVKYLQYQTMAPGSANKTDWMNKNKSWYSPLAQSRNTFFNSLPAGDPNKPQNPIQYPNADPQTAADIKTYNTLTNSAAKANFLSNHQNVIDQWNKQADYTNQMRVAQGYSALKNSPQPTAQLQKFMDLYNGASKADRKAIRNANPQAYQDMAAYYDSVDMYNINKQGAVSQLQGEPDYTSKQAKAIKNVASDIYQNPDGTYSIVPAGWMNGGSGGRGGYGSSGKGYGSKSQGLSKLTTALKASAAIKPPKAPAVTLAAAKQYTAPKLASGTPKLASFTAPKAPVAPKAPTIRVSAPKVAKVASAAPKVAKISTAGVTATPKSFSPASLPFANPKSSSLKAFKVPTQSATRMPKVPIPGMTKISPRTSIAVAKPAALSSYMSAPKMPSKAPSMAKMAVSKADIGAAAMKYRMPQLRTLAPSQYVAPRLLTYTPQSNRVSKKSKKK